MRKQGSFDPARLVFTNETCTNTAMVRRYGRRPRLGSGIDKHDIVRLEISKTRKKIKAAAVHAIIDCPMFAEELACTPVEQRIRPLVTCRLTNHPPIAQCQRFFRLIARQVVDPDDIWNMDARPSANGLSSARPSTVPKS
jgi:hypothetical protein